MSSTYDELLEVSQILEVIKEMKDKTLDHYQEDKLLASKLLIELNKLDNDCHRLIKQFESLL